MGSAPRSAVEVALRAFFYGDARAEPSGCRADAVASRPPPDTTDTCRAEGDAETMCDGTIDGRNETPNEPDTADSPAKGPDEAARPAWKVRMEEDFRRWLSSLPDEPPREQAPESTPDLRSFYEELAALRLHTGKTAKRTHETLSGFGTTLERFQEAIEGLRTDLSTRTAGEETAGPGVVVGLLDLLDSIDRLRERLDDRPRPGLLRAGRVWPAYIDSFVEGFGLAAERLDDLVESLGIERIETHGALFDPAFMSAVEVDREADVPDGTVVEEVTPGYRRNDTVVRYAEVRVARKER
ncbi:MAG: nucleotide exchange factor GrpE [Chitinivibrionales bacterium]|nr:nucleotide exchange factor GrpE [Chitinivibrionales bacterium]